MSEKAHAAGCVAYRPGSDGRLEYLVIRDQYGRWTVPKGHLDPGESEEQAAARETLEETGVGGELGERITTISYQVTNRRGETYRKRVAFFLLRADPAAHAAPQAAEGITAAVWLPADDALARIGYPQVRAVLAQAIEMAAAP